ncbi:hypothetical protein T4B_11464, partial [Trichinella pseudospiralis]
LVIAPVTFTTVESLAKVAKDFSEGRCNVIFDTPVTKLPGVKSIVRQEPRVKRINTSNDFTFACNIYVSSAAGSSISKFVNFSYGVNWATLIRHSAV